MNVHAIAHDYSIDSVYIKLRDIRASIIAGKKSIKIASSEIQTTRSAAARSEKTQTSYRHNKFLRRYAPFTKLKCSLYLVQTMTNNLWLRLGNIAALLKSTG